MSLIPAEMDDIELEKLLRGQKGAPCSSQVRVLRAIDGRLDADGLAKMPNLAEIARELGLSRQVVSAAVRALRRKGVLDITRREVVVRRRRERVVSVLLPDAQQLRLPFPQRRETPAPLIGPYAEALA